MKKTTKGAFAAGAAGVLLLGGAGTLAYWSDSETIGGGEIDSGELSLSQETGQTCTDWTLDAVGGGTAYTPGTTLVVPGDVITRTCTYTVNSTGQHLAADLTMESPTITAVTGTQLDDQLDIDATYTLGVATVLDGHDVTSSDDGKVLVATIKVTFDSLTAGLTAQQQTASLDDISVTLTQTHA